MTPGELLALVVAAGFGVYVTGGLAGAAVGAGAVAVELFVSRLGVRALRPPWRARAGRAGWLAAAAVLALLLPLLAKDEFALSLLSRALVLSLIVLSLNVVTGYTGQISIGHAALVGIGAYTTAIGVAHGGLRIVPAVALGALAAGAVGLLIGVPALRLRGHYLGMVTLAITVAFPAVLQVHELERYTGSFNGLSLFGESFGPPVAWAWLTQDRWYYAIVLVTVACAGYLVANLVASAAGRALIASRDHEIAAAAVGVNVAFAKVSAFVLSATLAGLAGGLWFLLNNRSVAPDGFTLTTSVEFLLALVVGGRASIGGSFLGGFFLVYVYQQGVQAFSLAFGAGTGGWPDWVVVVGVALGVAACLVRSARVRRVTARFTTVHTARWAVSLAVADLGIGFLVGLGFLYAFRSATESVLNLTALQPAFAGAVLLVVVLGAPGGLAALARAVASLTWGDVGERARHWLVPAGPASAAGQPRVDDGASTARREASWV